MMRLNACSAALALFISSGCGSVLLEGYEYGPGTSLEVTSTDTAAETATDTAAVTPAATTTDKTSAAAAPAKPKPPKKPQVADWSNDQFAEFVKSVPANPMGAGDSLEKHRDWTALNWANPAEASAWKRGKSDDDVLLVVRLKGGKKDKVAVSRDAQMAFAPDGKLRMDVYNSTDRKIDIAFAVHATVDDVYSESTTQPARPGWNRLEWDLAASTYKTEASGWKNTAKLWGGEEIKRLVILVYDPGKATVAFDRIEADQKATEAAE